MLHIGASMSSCCGRLQSASSLPRASLQPCPTPTGTPQGRFGPHCTSAGLALLRRCLILCLCAPSSTVIVLFSGAEPALTCSGEYPSTPSAFLYQSMIRPTKGEIRVAPASAHATACKQETLGSLSPEEQTGSPLGAVATSCEEKRQGQLPLPDSPCWQLRLLHAASGQILTWAKEKSSVMLVSMPCFCRTSHALMPSQVEAICSRHPTPLTSTWTITLTGQNWGRYILQHHSCGWWVRAPVYMPHATADVVRTGY